MPLPLRCSVDIEGESDSTVYRSNRLPHVTPFMGRCCCDCPSASLLCARSQFGPAIQKFSEVLRLDAGFFDAYEGEHCTGKRLCLGTRLVIPELPSLSPLDGGRDKVTYTEHSGLSALFW